jgi:hypothetical protein
MHNTETPDRIPHNHYILAITPTPRHITLDSPYHRPIDTNAIITAYMHLCRDAGYRDAYRTPHYHYTLLLHPCSSTHHAGFTDINTDGLVTAYMHQYRDTGPAPSQRQALGHDTDRPVMIILAHCCICTARHRCIAVESSVPQGMFVCFDKRGWLVCRNSGDTEGCRESVRKRSQWRERLRRCCG